MGVVIFGTIYFLAAYYVLGTALDRATLNRLFLYGIGSVPVLAVLSLAVSSVVGRLHPLPPPEAPRKGYGSLYYRFLRINGFLKLAFLIVLYHAVAASSTRPFLVLVAASVVFLLAIPQHLFRAWTRREAPDRYAIFILNHGTFAHRLLVVLLNLAIQSTWVVLSRGKCARQRAATEPPPNPGVQWTRYARH